MVNRITQYLEPTDLTMRHELAILKECGRASEACWHAAAVMSIILNVIFLGLHVCWLIK